MVALLLAIVFLGTPDSSTPHIAILMIIVMCICFQVTLRPCYFSYQFVHHTFYYMIFYMCKFCSGMISVACLSTYRSYINAIQGGCMTVTILLQYFYLASFMWMLMEGGIMYIVLIKVWAQIHWKYYLGLSLLCYDRTDNYLINFSSW